MTREEEKKKARWEYVSKRLANPDFPTYNAEYELEAAFDTGAEWANEHPHWISVEDELPKERQSCIILIDRKALQGTPRIRSAVYAPNVMMQQEGFAYNRMSKKHHITHWMPLPQAPKEGGAL